MEITEEIRKFLTTHESPVLFAGAGVSARAGIPTWGKYLEYLAEISRVYDPITRHIMMERIREGSYTDAAAYYYLCGKIPEAEKYQALSKPLREYDHTKIVALTDLPFTAFVTTNFDRALNDASAISRKASAVDVHLGDPTMSAAPFQTDFYIARIHGRCEAPVTMVLENRHYENLSLDAAYIDFLTHIFTRKQVLFLGFSFLDPAISSVLETVRDHVGKVHQGRHLALLPEGTNDDLVNMLETYSISKLFYDPSNNHEALWSSLESVREILSAAHKTISQDTGKIRSLASAHKYLATCYSRSKLGSKINPLRNAVVEGIIGQYLAEHGSEGASSGQLNSAVQDHLSLNESDADQLVSNAVALLHKDGLCGPDRKDSGRLIWTGKDDDSYEAAILTLIKGVINRYIVREAGVDTPDLRVILRSFFEKLVLARGWDLGAAFAANRSPESVDVYPLMNSVERFKELDLSEHINGLSRAVEDLINKPNSQEAQILAELGRVSFALELIIQAPHDTLFHRLTLPQRIYLDANVLMPAVTVGHPYHNVYKATIKNLLEAGTQSLINVRVAAYHGFLNEVVSHRRKAVEEIEHIEDDLFDTLRRKALLSGTTNMNVFVGAYANLLAANKEITFDKFLRKYAPYESEDDLTRWLTQQGIEILKDKDMKRTSTTYPDILHELEVGYSEAKTLRHKDAVLIRHDATQLAALHEDEEVGIKSIFVSADKRLREVVSGGKFSNLANYMVSHIGLTQIIDLLVGNPVESKGLSRMLWSGKLSEKTEQVRNYLIDIALNEYDDAVAMEMNKVVDSIAEDIIIEADKNNINIPPNTAKEEEGLIKILGTYEDIYFANMRELIEKRRPN